MKRGSYKKKKIYRYLIAIIILALLTVLILILKKPVKTPEESDLLYGKVVYVIDGDTIKFQVDKNQSLIIENGNDNNPEAKDIPEDFDMDGENIIRLIGIDCPESASHDESKNTEEGRLATEYVKSLIEGKTVGLEFDIEKKDKYDRFLAYVWLDGTLVNKDIYQAGHGELMMIPPNTKYEDYYLEPRPNP